MSSPKILIIFLFFSTLAFLFAQNCQNIGSQGVHYDEACSQGSSLGCNAGGQGQNCRFCGFGVFTWLCQPPIPETTPTPTPTSTPTPTPPSAVVEYDFSFINKCTKPVWVGGQGKSVSNSKWTMPNKGGWYLGASQTSTIKIPADFTAGRFWARTGCATVNGQFTCDTGYCGPWVQCAWDGVQRGGNPPVTLAEFSLNAWGGQDYYDVSLVDGYNVPIKIKPKTYSYERSGDYWCKSIGCNSDINTICPTELRKYGRTGGVVACLSACEKFNTDSYCCRGAYNKPETCKSSTWPTNYPALFKKACPTAYSYAYDDATSTYFCKKTGYDITFC